MRHPTRRAACHATPRTCPATGQVYPRSFGQKILTSKSALEGERKQVTVLFADLKGSMELLADRDPEDARAILDQVLERMMAAVHRYEGTVNQVMGDGIMALFGAPIAHEDHAIRACYAALAMQASVKQYAAEVQRTRGVPTHIRVGLNSGELVVRSIGSDLHMDYTAVGQTTHLAARMEQMAMPSSIVITADVLRLVEGYVQVKPLGPVPIKGRLAPAEVYEVTGAGSVRSRLQAAGGRGLTRFVGRDTELDQLRQPLERAGACQGQVVAVIGEPGVSKSRLFWEFTHSHRTHGWLILESRSVSYGKATAYLSIIDLLKTYCQLDDRDDVRRVREQVTGKLLILDRALEPALPAILALLEVPVEDAQWQALDPPQRRRHTLEAVKRLLIRESQLQPVLLVFEDLHWIDSETQALLDSLVESLPTARLLLLVNYRPEYQNGWGSKSYYTQLRLDPLPPASAEVLLENLLGSEAGLASLKERLIQLTQGNPHYALGTTWLRLGALPTARTHLEEGIARYTPAQRRAPVFQIGQDPGVTCRAYAALTLWLLGYPDQALAPLHDALALAHALSHPFSLAWARCMAAIVSQCRRDVSAVHEHAEAAGAIATEQGFTQWALWGTILRGWALAMQDQGEEGMAQMRQGIAAWRATGAVLIVPYFCTLLADVPAHLGHTEEGLQALAEAHTLVEQHEERYWEVKISRLRGVLLLRQTGTSQAEAEAWLRRALDVARRQEAKALELRAVMSLSRLWQQQGKRADAYELPAPIYGWFTEGFDTADLQEAQALLEELS